MEPPETPYDLRWQMFGVRVRVHPFFWLASALLGWSWYNVGGPLLLLLWIGVVFASILIHEFGHVLTGWYFGSKGQVVLYMFGGLAVGSTRLSQRWQRVAVTLAGPFAQLLLLAIVFGVLVATENDLAEVLRYYLFGGARPFLLNPTSPYLVDGLLMIAFVNFFWPILNLLPIFPLDGGQVTREVCEGVSPHEGTRFALGISMVVAGILALHFFLGEHSPIPFLRQSSPINGIFFVVLAASSFQMMMAVTAQRRSWDDDRLPWER
jgi:membrane-associated protease RseP (regulator of RpoE activity)